jgi:peptidoglycan-associated lipoprotein
MNSRLFLSVAFAAVVASSACAKKAPVVSAPPPPPGPSAFPSASNGAGAADERPPAPPAVPLDSGVRSSAIGAGSVQQINDSDALKPVLFLYDSDELDEAAKKVLSSNAEMLKANRTWIVTVEGHCDERGSAEYNLALGDRRALAAKNYLVTLGIAADRLRTVSYGKEFPFDPGHEEASWAKNRRAHFLLTAK